MPAIVAGDAYLADASALALVAPVSCALATSPMIAASSLGRDHIGQWLVGRSIHVVLRSSGIPARKAQSGCSAAYVRYCSAVKPVQMNVLGMSRRASFVNSTDSRINDPGTGTAR